MSQDTPLPKLYNVDDINSTFFFEFYVNGFEEQIDSFIEALSKTNVKSDSDMEMSDFLKPLKDIMVRIVPPFTVVLENNYVDRVFRDSYYKYFSSSHFDTSRSSRRLSFFQGTITSEEFFDTEKYTILDIQESQECCSSGKKIIVYYGSIVINPLMTGAIGRTIIDPRCLNLTVENDRADREITPAYMRLSRFKAHVYGRSLTVSAFPYRMQDGETTRCAEITILNLLDYYSNHYPEYRSALPGEILDEEERHSFERVLPSKGMSYAVMSKLMSNFGFYPRLYDLYSIEAFQSSCVTPIKKLKRWMYYYIESGIPVAVELGTGKSKESGHSVICIGHGVMDKTQIGEAYKISSKHGDGRTFINSADFYNSFVIIDDNEPIYNIREYEKLSTHEELKLTTLAVPLNRRMCMDAPDAEQSVLTILNDDILGLDNWLNTISPGYLNDDEAIVMRLFLASSHSFKSYRVKTLPSIGAKELYAYVPMPRFVWVCELYRLNAYLNSAEDDIYAFAEIVLDSTTVSTLGYPDKGLLLAHYPGVIATRYPDEVHIGFDNMATLKNDGPFKGFRNNLSLIR